MEAGLKKGEDLLIICLHRRQTADILRMQKDFIKKKNADDVMVSVALQAGQCKVIYQSGHLTGTWTCLYSIATLPKGSVVGI